MLTYEVYQLKVQQFGFINYIYLIIDKYTKKTAIVDPSWNTVTVFNLLDKLKVEVDAILLTHSHIDHVYMTDALLQRYQNAKVYMSDVECSYYNFFSRNLIRLHDMNMIRIGETNVTCILTPGHTKGSMCYLLEESLFTGDTIFSEGCGMCKGPGANACDMYYSLQKVKEIVSPNVRMYAGHSYGRQPGEILSEVMDHNIYFQIEDINKFIEFRNRKGQDNLFKFI
ncbi:TPA: MBL fold metallo-hydrolase [Streptococcus mutans]|uniref:MBL fold metallo-hydrolase n=1 Tax=Streptococcus mutans TaxID=1309 RepID=UPI0014551515|nr:MBL fold metallo-hydrolase [Streptococcus mutans]MCB5112919.1 MBL fold metallo-hydrolase [Streptococcus mutans]MCB5139185.1 MBL fold metallo-hydrolase [Streptococcus mutans]NLQ71061.1 MBL fold metallo-hydrolase [Streptococcus mutans]